MPKGKPTPPPDRKMRPIKSRKLIPEWMKNAAYTPPDTRTGNFQRETGKYDDSGNEHVGINTNAITPAVHIHLHGPSSTGMPLDIQKAAKLRNKKRN